MTKRRILTIILAFTLAVFTASGQVNEVNNRQKVLEKGIVDSLFIFGKWKDPRKTETHLKYLGQVTTKSGRTFKIVNSIWFWGLSHRATSRILVFNDKNQYVGNYKLGMTFDLPDKLENGELIFTNFDNKECDSESTTKVDFVKGLPKVIFIKCKGKYGDSYKFSSDE